MQTNVNPSKTYRLFDKSLHQWFEVLKTSYP